MRQKQEPLSLFELVLLSALWMLFGFMIWYYLSAWHGVPVRLVSGEILSKVLGEPFHSIIPNPDRHYLFQVQTRIPFDFPDGTREPLGFIVNPLVYGYGLPLLFGLSMASSASLLRKFLTLGVGYVVILVVQIWGVVWQSLMTLSFNFGPDAHAAVAATGISQEVIALCYQLGTLIFPALIPVIIWVLANWKEVEQYVGWRPPSRNA
jgi:hypothetical protein